MRIKLISPLVLLFVLAIPALPANAHVGKNVGAYTLDIGWGDEPTVAGFKNTIQVLVHEGEEFVDDVGEGLKVEVSFGDSKKTVQLTPAFEVGERGTPGDYKGSIIPTRAGRYTFRVFGTIRKQKVDVSVTSGPDTFSEVADAGDDQFPVKDPTQAQLSERLDREVPRLETRSVALVSDTKDAKSSASTATILGIVGIVLASAALVMSLMKGRSKA